MYYFKIRLSVTEVLIASPFRSFFDDNGVRLRLITPLNHVWIAGETELNTMVGVKYVRLYNPDYEKLILLYC